MKKFLIEDKNAFLGYELIALGLTLITFIYTQPYQRKIYNLNIPESTDYDNGKDASKDKSA